MGNLARNMVQDVRLRDTVSCVSTNPGHDLATVTEEVTVEGSKSTTGEGELRSTVVGEKGVGVLEERDQYQPMVDP